MNNLEHTQPLPRDSPDMDDQRTQLLNTKKVRELEPIKVVNPHQEYAENGERQGNVPPYNNQPYNNQPQNCPCQLHSGCLYTGDSTLYKGLIESLQVKLGANMKYIGIIQVPHHGSKSSCKNRILEISKQSMYYFLSYGEGNTYGHPSNDVIKELIYGGKQIFCVNQFKTTSLIQYSII